MALVSSISRNKVVSSALLADMKRTFTVTRTLERQSLELKKKLVKERKIAYAALASRGRGTDKGFGAGGGLLGGALGIRGLRTARRFLGGGGGSVTRGGGGGPKFPRLPGRGPRITGGGRFKLPRLGGGARITGAGLRGARVGPLAILATGVDFTSRLGSGQNLTQATIGAGGGLAGALAGGATGAKIGAAIGTFFGPGIGTAIGGAIGGIGGSIIGGVAGSGLADFFTGANRRRDFEKKRTLQVSRKTSFSGALDKFDRVLDKFAKLGRSGIFIGYTEELQDEELDIGDIVPIQRPPRFRAIIDSIGYTALGLGLATLAIVGLVNIFDGPLSETAFGSLALAAFKKAPWLKRLSILKKPLFTRVKPTNIPKVEPPKFQRIETSVKQSDIQDLLRRGKLNKLQEFLDKPIKKSRKINKKLGETVENKNSSKNIDEFNLFDNEIFKNLKGLQNGGEVSAGEPIVLGEIEPEVFIPTQDGVIIPTGGGRQKILVVNNGGTIQKVPVAVGGGGGETFTAPVTSDVYSNLAKYAQFTSLLTV